MRASPPQWIEPERAEDARLAVDLIPPAKRPSRLWFFIPGLNSHRRGEKSLYFARQVARKGEAFASLDLTGHGESGGSLRELSLTRNLRDVERGLRYVDAAIGPFSSTVLVGSSMGGLAALWYAARHPDRITTNVTLAPAFEMAGRLLLALGRDKARKWREEGVTRMKADHAEFDLGYGFVQDESHYPTASLMKALLTPTLILHGTEDDVVPCQLSVNFARRSEVVTLILVEGGDHRLTAHKEKLFEQMWSFVDRHQVG